MRKLAFITIAALVSLSACKKDDEEPVNNNPDDFRDMVVSDSFDWRSTDEVTLNVEGLVTDHPASSTLYVSKLGGAMLVKRYVSIDETFSLELTLPSTEDQLVVRFNTIVDTVDVVNGQADFSYLPDDLPGDEE
ncbi:hypothetical protein HZ996_08035 [Cryomorphaceae bacterium]|nr:hypothetical protein HZ996_08035 [Cryomorphaceae bacterium]